MYACLKHNDHIIAALEIAEDTGVISNYQCICPEEMPYFKKMSLKEINFWWKYRAVPEERSDLKKILQKAGYDSPLIYQAKNLALSLTDCYWVCPISIDLSWDKVNFYDNTQKTVFKSKDGENFSNDPNVSLNGSMLKEAIFDGQWFLKKYGESPNAQQCINEKFASMIHKAQNFTNFVSYEVQFRKSKVYSCTCPFFTSKNLEFIPAYDFTNGIAKRNDLSPYEEYINRCVEYGLMEDQVRLFMDYQTLTDFILTNTDRHYNNFGVLRDPQTLKIVSQAPIFDSGNSMFYKTGQAMNAYEILSGEITSMAKYEEKMLGYVKNKDAVNISLLPSKEDVVEFYIKNGVDEETALNIGHNYELKIQMLDRFQKGNKISRYTVKDWKTFIDKTEDSKEAEPESLGQTDNAPDSDDFWGLGG